MVALRKLPTLDMTVDEFMEWDSGDTSGALWQLRDGVPEMMAPTTSDHGRIQSELVLLIGPHLRQSGDRCHVIIDPGVIPRLRSERNALIPDIGVTCAPLSDDRLIEDPVLLIEIMSPDNEPQTRANIWAYSTIPSVAEMLIVGSIKVFAEMSRRRPDGSWPADPVFHGPEDDLVLESIGLTVPLRAAYRTTRFR